jgi:hypothetical protein
LATYFVTATGTLHNEYDHVAFIKWQHGIFWWVERAPNIIIGKLASATVKWDEDS